MIQTLPSGLTVDVSVKQAFAWPDEVRAFIIGTWARSGGRGCVPLMSGKAASNRSSMLRKRAAHVLELPSTYVSVVNFETVGPTDVPVGWTVAAPNIIHYAFVRTTYRQLGLAALMLSTFARLYQEKKSECPFAAEGWLPCTHWSVKFPKEGWVKHKRHLLFYAGFEPLSYRNANAVEVSHSA